MREITATPSEASHIKAKHTDAMLGERTRNANDHLQVFIASKAMTEDRHWKAIKVIRAIDDSSKLAINVRPFTSGKTDSIGFARHGEVLETRVRREERDKPIS